MSTPGAASQDAASIKPATGKLGIMIPGMGAVATTLIAGVEAVRRGLAKPIGSTTQMGTIRLGKRTEDRTRSSRTSPPSPSSTTSSSPAGTSSAATSTTLPRPPQVLDRDQLESMKPFPRVHRADARGLRPALRQAPRPQEGQKVGKNKCDLANQIRNDIAEFKTKTDRQVMIWCGSTEIFLEPSAVHQTLEAFEKGLVDDDPGISPLDALRLGRAEGRHPVRQRRAESHGRHSCAASSCRRR
jgi:myo-inositol-1-phosphate synthase